MYIREDEKQKLNWCLQQAASIGALEELRELLDAGADFSPVEGYRPALCEATAYGHLDCVRLLLDRGAPVDERVDARGMTPLMYAAYEGYLDIAKLLVQRGAQADLPVFSPWDTELITISELAAKYGHSHIVDFLAAAESVQRDEVELSRPLAGGGVLQEIYSFADQERITLARSAGKTGPVEAMTRELFEDVSEKALRRAFNAYAALGGKMDMDEAIGRGLPKKSLTGLRTVQAPGQAPSQGATG